MAENKNGSSGRTRNWLAFGTMGFSALAITVLAGIIIIQADPKSNDAMTVFNVVLPVFASWVGTILAFYYGRENFESASQEIRKMADKISPEERAKALVTAAMRAFSTTEHFAIPAGKSEQDIKLSELKSKFSDTITRLPVTDADKKPKYMIHQSSVNSYIASGGKLEHTLKEFITTQEGAGIEFGLDRGFVVVSEQSTLAEAKGKMEEKAPCQDIFITRGGTPDEPLTGWLSNVRMAKYLEA